mgnify:CR=1 FL=1
MKKLHYSVLKRLNKLLRPQFSVVRRNSVRLLLNKYNWIDNRLLCFRSYEKKNIDFMLDSLKNEGFERFLDIGANIGYFSLMAAKKTDVANIMAFEPMSKNFYQLCTNILLNGFSGRILPVNKALSDKNEVSEIHYDIHSTGIGTLKPDQTVRDKRDYNQSEMIKCIRFDDMYDFQNEKIFIKMDVEQFELHVLKGMPDFLKQNRIWLMIEINDETSPVFAFLKKSGFKKIDSDTDDFVFSNFA